MADDPVLGEQLSAIGEAESRASLALFVTGLASAAILGALWNSYLSWDAQWSQTVAEPTNWGERVLLEQQIQTWQQSNDVSVSVLGIHLSVSDAAVLGSAVLLALGYWVLISMRHLNGEIGTVIRANAEAPAADRWRIFNRIRAGMVLDPPVAAPPIASIKEEVSYSVRSGSSALLANLLLLLPAITVTLIVASDLYFAFLYDSPFRPDHDVAWKSLAPHYRAQLILIDSFAVIADLLLIRFAFLASRYHRATVAIVREFWGGLGT